jgi:hypothetical protein
MTKDQQAGKSGFGRFYIIRAIGGEWDIDIRAIGGEWDIEQKEKYGIFKVSLGRW